MSESTTKIFTVTGDAATRIGGTRKRKSSKKATAAGETMKVGKEAAKIVPTTGQRGGTSPGTTLQVEANRAPGGAEPLPAAFKNSTAGLLTKSAAESTPASAHASVPLQGGAVKVILEKKKKGKVILAPMKVRKLNPVTHAQQPGHTNTHSQAKTRKVAKKIRMSLNGFGKRVTRANTIRVDAKKQKIEDVKKTLVEAKLVKESSKAPEGVLRQIYSDYMMLKNRAL